jgi:hypothetical protein
MTPHLQKGVLSVGFKLRHVSHICAAPPPLLYVALNYEILLVVGGREMFYRAIMRRELNQKVMPHSCEVGRDFVVVNTVRFVA